MLAIIELVIVKTKSWTTMTRKVLVSVKKRITVTGNLSRINEELI